jgi:hypothetical protein
VGKLLIVPYITKKSIRAIRTRKAMPINNNAVMRKPINVITNSNYFNLHFILRTISVGHVYICKKGKAIPATGHEGP